MEYYKVVTLVGDDWRGIKGAHKFQDETVLEFSEDEQLTFDEASKLIDYLKWIKSDLELRSIPIETNG